MVDATNGDRPRSQDLRVAVVGAGPAGYYSALDLLAQESLDAHVDLFDRLPAPYGLVRYGVAPDHGKIRNVTKVYDRGVEAAGDRFRFFGHVELGTDISLDELMARYNAVILTFGAQTDMHLGVPGEGLPQVYGAREFVAWYNGHPDFANAPFDLSADRAIVVGIGNVAIDVARILARTRDELALTDISDIALAALAGSRVREIDIVARRGPLQAKTTPSELLELTHMADADLVVAERDLELDPVSQAVIDRGHDVSRQSLRNLEIMREEARREPRPGRCCVRLRFYLSPVEVHGTDRVTGVTLRRNTIQEKTGGYLGVVATDETEDLDCGLIFRSIGYKGRPLPGLPFDADRGVFPNTLGRITDQNDNPIPQLYTAGWIKRGPSGIIGTNRACGVETADSLLNDIDLLATNESKPGAEGIYPILDKKKVRHINFMDWKKIDQHEIDLGKPKGKPRDKLTSVADMLKVLD